MNQAPLARPTPPAAPAAQGAHPARALAYMLAGSALFSVMALCVAFAHRADVGLSTFTTSAVRSVVNLLVLVALSWRNPRQLLGDLRPALFARGVFGGVALISYFASLQSLTVGEAAFLNQTSAAWVALLGPLLLGQPTGGAAWLAVAGSLVGMALLAHPRPDGADAVGRLLGALSGLAAAGAYLSVNRASGTNSPVTIVFWFTLISSAASIVLALATNAALPADGATAAWLVGAGLSATVAQLLMTAAYRDGHAASVAAAGAASPLLTALLGWGLLDQAPDGRAAYGMAILFVCSMILPFWGARKRR